MSIYVFLEKWAKNFNTNARNEMITDLKECVEHYLNAPETPQPEPMGVDEAIRQLTIYNTWRRGAEIPQPDVKMVGMAIDVAIRELKEV
jgi:hypothetical protein